MRRVRTLFAATFALLLAVSAALAFGLGKEGARGGFGGLGSLGGVQVWPPVVQGQKAVWYADIRHNKYYYNGVTYTGQPGAEATPFNSWLSALGGTFTRSSAKWVVNYQGVYTQLANNAAPFEYDFLTGAYLGLVPEGSRTNVVLWNRDLTNAAWTASNVTRAKDQVGIDGVANSASSITATANNGTLTQAITLASSQRFQSAFIKRLNGVGAISMSMDGGSTFTGVNAGQAWSRVSIPAQTLANPSVVFKLGTSGDKIAVDFVQNEDGPNASTPMLVTTAAFTRSQDLFNLGLGWLNVNASTWLVGISAADPNTFALGVHYIDSIQFNGANRAVDLSRYSSSSSINVVQFVASSVTTDFTDTSNYSYDSAARFAASTQVGASYLSVNGGAIPSGQNPGSMPSLANLNETGVGRYYPDNSGPSFDHYQVLGYWNVAGSNADVIRLSTVPGFSLDRSRSLASWGDSLAGSNGSSTPTQWWLAEVANALARPYYNAGVGGSTSTQMAAAQGADTAHQNWLDIYWTGHNNPTPASTVVADINTAIAHQTTTGGKYLVLSPLQNSGDSYLGTNYNNKLSLRSALQTAFGSNYVDVQAALLANGNGSAPDNNAIAQGYTPPSLQSDQIHLNDAGYAIVAATVQAALVAKGW